MTDEHSRPVVQRFCDVAILGGSAAGLAAALQLARQRRSVIVIDDATPRNGPAQHVHGYLGHEGTPPAELSAVGRAEVRDYGAEVLTGRALAVRRVDDQSFRIELTGGHSVIARRVLAATGIVDELPKIEGLDRRWGRDVVGCPFCHGFELRDQRVVQIVTHPMGLHQTPLLRHLTDRLTVVLHGADGWDQSTVDEATARLGAAGVPVVRDAALRIVTTADDRLLAVATAGGSMLEAEAIVVGSRFRARVETLAAVGVLATAHPTGLGDAVEVDMTGQTSAPGIYAAGNLTDPSMQVLHAAGHGSRIGAMIAVDLAGDDLDTGRSASGPQTDWEHRYSGEPIWSANPNGTLVDLLDGVAPGRALDVGAGEGADALWLAERGWTVTATDISANALARIGAEAQRRGLDVHLARADANDPEAFGPQTYDLVSLQYGSFHRTPDRRGLGNLLGAVAPGGTLLVVGHDLAPMREPVDVNVETRMFDPDAYVGIDEIARSLHDSDAWRIELQQTRPRPAGAATHHVHDVVLLATKLEAPTTL